MLISVRVIPRSGKNAIEWIAGEPATLKVRLTAPPVEGAANEALIELLADRLHVPRRTINIVRGAASRQKTVEIAGLTLEEMQHRLPGT